MTSVREDERDDSICLTEAILSPRLRGSYLILSYLISTLYRVSVALRALRSDKQDADKHIEPNPTHTETTADFPCLLLIRSALSCSVNARALAATNRPPLTPRHHRADESEKDATDKAFLGIRDIITAIIFVAMFTVVITNPLDSTAYRTRPN